VHPGLHQLKVMSAIEHCRTAALGGHTEACTDYGKWRTAYNSCRNRRCQRCQRADAHTWPEAREADLLPVCYFHVVFTLPAKVADIAYHNKAVLYDSFRLNEKPGDPQGNDALTINTDHSVRRSNIFGTRSASTWSPCVSWSCLSCPERQPEGQHLHTTYDTRKTLRFNKEPGTVRLSTLARSLRGVTEGCFSCPPAHAPVPKPSRHAPQRASTGEKPIFASRGNTGCAIKLHLDARRSASNGRCASGIPRNPLNPAPRSRLGSTVSA